MITPTLSFAWHQFRLVHLSSHRGRYFFREVNEIEFGTFVTKKIVLPIKPNAMPIWCSAPCSNAFIKKPNCASFAVNPSMSNILACNSLLKITSVPLKILKVL